MLILPSSGAKNRLVLANTLTVFPIQEVGLAVAFPLWNINSLTGLIWGRALFCELKGASAKNIGKVVAGAVCIVIAAVMLGLSTLDGGTRRGTVPRAASLPLSARA